jgi:hypothetical protein
MQTQGFLGYVAAFAKPFSAISDLVSSLPGPNMLNTQPDEQARFYAEIREVSSATQLVRLHG